MITVTKHEREIIQTYVDISSREEAARYLGMSFFTLKNSIYKLRQKFDAKDETELAVKAFCVGLIQ